MARFSTAESCLFMVLFCVIKYDYAEQSEISEKLQGTGTTRSINKIQPDIFVINDSVPLDEENMMRRNKVKQMMKHSWDNYVKYAWGENELWPKQKRGNSRSDSYGSVKLGATIITALDTLYIMGMMDEFQQGQDWIANNFTLENADAELVVSEVNVGIIGGLLSCYALTGDVMFRDKAEYVAQKLLPVFNTPTGIPFATIYVQDGFCRNHGWAYGGCSILAEFGALHLEFTYLSDVTGNGIYKAKVDQIRKFVKELEKPEGLYHNFLNPRTGQWGKSVSSLGGGGDRFYEYLLKGWIQSGKEDNESRKMYDIAVQAVMNRTLFTSRGGHTYLTELIFGSPANQMDHNSCFAGGLLSLGAYTHKSQYTMAYMEIAEKLTDTCHQSYNHTDVNLGPERFAFTDSVELKILRYSEDNYKLQPHVVESYYTLWKITKDNIYREWGWEAAQAIERYCQTPNGYSGIYKLYMNLQVADKVQPPYFLAATLKYLYLLFSDNNVISLDEWVFNTEGHPLPIKGANPYYRLFSQAQKTS